MNGNIRLSYQPKAYYYNDSQKLAQSWTSRTWAYSFKYQKNMLDLKGKISNKSMLVDNVFFARQKGERSTLSKIKTYENSIQLYWN